jgi:teichuronic acid biosynthesis glycosyltransferase TuaC
MKEPGKIESPGRLLVLSKRQYTGKDLLSNRFGRCWELPAELANIGYSVTGIALSYRKRQAGRLIQRTALGRGNIEWHSVNLGKMALPGLVAYFRLVNQLIREQRPDAILAMSDAPHILFGTYFARRYGIKMYADLYDNFESFTLTRLPGIRPAFRKAVMQAGIVICVSEELQKFVKSNYGRSKNILVIPNAANTELFGPKDRLESRKRLNLPLDKKLIGTAGALFRNRDIEVLFRAADLLALQDPDMELVVAGQRERNLAWPEKMKVHDLGQLSHNEVPYLINALDVAIVSNRDSDFGRYCFPQKLTEILACKVPVVAADVGVAKAWLSNYPECLYPPGDADRLSQQVLNQMRGDSKISVEQKDWKALAVLFDQAIRGSN